MKLRAFADGLDRYGADLAKWPATPGQAARALAAGDRRAAALLADAAGFEAALRAGDPAATMDEARAERLTRRVMRLTAERLPAPPPRLAAGGRRRVWATAPRGWVPRFAMPMAAAAMLGGWLGLHLPAHDAADASPASLAALVTPATTSPMGL